MNQKIKLFSHPMSRGRIVRWMLEEIGQPYDVVMLEYGGNMKSPEHLALNPMGKVPTITHGSAVVTESAAICAYLADAFPEAGLAPPLAQRADYYRWMFFSHGPLEQAVINHALGFELPPGKSGMAGYGSLKSALDAVEHAIQGKDYLVNRRFSAADVVLGSQIGFGLRFGTIEKRPEFERYWSTLAARPAHRAAEAIDNALLPARN